MARDGLCLLASQLLLVFEQGPAGALALASSCSNSSGLVHPTVVPALLRRLQISAATASAGAIFGFLVAYVPLTGTPRSVSAFPTTFSGVAANFARLPLAFAFIATLPTAGPATQLIPLRSRSRPRRTALPSLLPYRVVPHVSFFSASSDEPRHCSCHWRPPQGVVGSRLDSTSTTLPRPAQPRPPP